MHGSQCSWRRWKDLTSFFKKNEEKLNLCGIYFLWVIMFFWVMVALDFAEQKKQRISEIKAGLDDADALVYICGFDPRFLYLSFYILHF